MPFGVRAQELLGWKSYPHVISGKDEQKIVSLKYLIKQFGILDQEPRGPNFVAVIYHADVVELSSRHMLAHEGGVVPDGHVRLVSVRGCSAEGEVNESTPAHR